ncbi:transposase [Streptomyces sp. AD55]|uniref:transposase n=1 Tax=Streptomyces sp. AD55 TaxID=3242895 RepID=UPI003526CC5C
MAAQYCGVLGKTANCQVVPRVHLVTEAVSCPVKRRVSLTAEMTTGSRRPPWGWATSRAARTRASCGTSPWPRPPRRSAPWSGCARGPRPRPDGLPGPGRPAAPPGLPGGVGPTVPDTTAPTPARQRITNTRRS